MVLREPGVETTTFIIILKHSQDSKLSTREVVFAHNFNVNRFVLKAGVQLAGPRLTKVKVILSHLAGTSWPATGWLLPT